MCGRLLLRELSRMKNGTHYTTMCCTMINTYTNHNVYALNIPIETKECSEPFS